MFFCLCSSCSHGLRPELLWSQLLHLPHLAGPRPLSLFLLHPGPHRPPLVLLPPRDAPLHLLPEIWHHNGTQVHPSLVPLRFPTGPVRPSPRSVCGFGRVAGCDRRRAPGLCSVVRTVQCSGLGLGYSSAPSGETESAVNGQVKRSQCGTAADLGFGVCGRDSGLHFLVQPSLVVESGERSTTGEMSLSVFKFCLRLGHHVCCLSLNCVKGFSWREGCSEAVWIPWTTLAGLCVSLVSTQRFILGQQLACVKYRTTTKLKKEPDWRIFLPSHCRNKPLPPTDSFGFVTTTAWLCIFFKSDHTL